MSALLINDIKRFPKIHTVYQVNLGQGQNLNLAVVENTLSGAAQHIQG